MMTFKKAVGLCISVAILLSGSACGQKNEDEKQASTPMPKEAKAVTLTVSAAASLKDAMDEIKTAYTKENGNVTLTINYGASGSLEQQIEQGAEVDIFISAAQKQMDMLKDKNLIMEDTRKDLLGNKVVLVVPKDMTGISDFKDLTGEKVKKLALGEPKSVPVGQYAEEVLTKLDLLKDLKAKEKIVYGKDVKEVLTWVETGNADAGIVYETDAKTSAKVRVAAKAQDGTHQPVIYPAAAIKASKNMDASKALLNYIYSEKAKPIFEKYGFTFLAK